MNDFDKVRDDVRLQRRCELPSGDEAEFEAKLNKIKCPLKNGQRVRWYHEEDVKFYVECGGHPRNEAPYSGLVICIPDVELSTPDAEMEWEDCVVVMDFYPTEKCYPEVHWEAMGRLLDRPGLVEIF